MAPAVQAQAQESDIVFCAPRETGMSDEDRGYFEGTLRDMSRFPAYADRLQQGALNTLLLGRLMAHPTGLAANRAFQGADGAPLYETPNLYFDTDGFGGNFGSMVTALAPDFQRAVLGSAGMRYSLIFTRSTTFTPFSEMLKTAYSGRMQRMVVLALAQMLWDRAEANGYTSRMRGDPPPNTPIHDVLFQTAVGDHQVPPISSEIMARTVGATVRDPAYDTGRYADKIPFYGLSPAPRLELGTTLTMWDGGPVRAGGLGTDLPPVPDIPPASGADPHNLVPETKAARDQRSVFLQPSGKLLEVCPVQKACRTASYPY